MAGSGMTDVGRWTGPAWLGPGYAFAGHWEPLVFRRRRGGQRTDEAERYAREHSAEALAGVQASGARLVVTHFDKGFGPSAQAEDLAVARRWAADLHAAGLLVGAYIRYDNIVPETIGADLPDSADWIARTGAGEPAAILDQAYRLAAQPTHEGHLAHIDALVVQAIEDLGADLIHLDGFWTQNLAWADASPGTVQAFRSFLRVRYPDDAAATERFGHPQLDALTPPVFREPDLSLSAVTRATDPVLQEWLDFRAHLTAGLAARFARVAKQAAAARGREVAVTVNSLIPIGYSNGLYWGFEVDQLGPHVDGMWTEDDHWPHLREDGVLVSRIREFKIGSAVGARVFSYQRATSERQLQVSLAQAIAFNDGVIGMLGSPLVAEEPYFEAKAAAMGWLSEHGERLVGNSSAADVALWRSSRTLTFEATVAHRSVILAEQMLIQGRVAFDVVFDDVVADPAALDRYRVLVLADTACMSDAQVAAVEAYVRRGGGVVVTGRTSLYDQWYRRRPDLGLRAVLGPDVLLDEGDPWQAPSTALAGDGPFARYEAGGRVAYLPEIRTPRPPDYTGVHGELPYRFSTEEWQVPTMSTDFVAAVGWARGGEASLTVDAPDGLAVDLQRGPDGSTVVHLVDFDLQRAAGARVSLTVRHPGAADVAITPFGGPSAAATFVRNGDMVRVDLDVDVYAGVVIA